MSTLESDERVRTEDTVEVIDCGQASERTKGWGYGVSIEFGISPFDWYIPI